MRTLMTSLGKWIHLRIDAARQRAAGWLQYAGLALFDVGCFHVADWLGWMFAGAAVAFVGWVSDE